MIAPARTRARACSRRRAVSTAAARAKAHSQTRALGQRLRLAALGPGWALPLGLAAMAAWQTFVQPSSASPAGGLGQRRDRGRSGAAPGRSGVVPQQLSAVLPTPCKRRSWHGMDATWEPLPDAARHARSWMGAEMNTHTPTPPKPHQPFYTDGKKVDNPIAPTAKTLRSRGFTKFFEEYLFFKVVRNMQLGICVQYKSHGRKT